MEPESPAPMTPRTRMAASPDLDAIVKIHLSSFPGFFLTLLGGRFLRLLYKEILEDPEGLLIVAEQQNSVVAFAGGVTRQTGFYGRLVRKRKWAARYRGRPCPFPGRKRKLLHDKSVFHLRLRQRHKSPSVLVHGTVG